MKGEVLALLVVFTCSWAASLAGPRPCQQVSVPDCLHPAARHTLHPHEARCDAFYRCDELSVPRAYTCPPGQHFAGVGGGAVCLPAHRVPCTRCLTASARSSCGIPSPTPPPCMTSPPPTTPSVTTERYTPVRSTTERITPATDPPSPTPHLTTERVEPCPVTPRCRLLELDTNKPYPPDCSKFVHCNLGVVQIRACPAGQYFSPVFGACTNPAIARCPLCYPTAGEDVSTPEATVQTSDSTTGQNTASTEELTTGQDTTWTEELTTDQGTTWSAAHTTSPPAPPCSADPECPTNRLQFSLTLPMPYPPDCTKYIMCVDGEKEIRDCKPPGTHFSRDHRNCRSPEEARCPYCVLYPITLGPHDAYHRGQS